jgi:hypothetical protein
MGLISKPGPSSRSTFLLKLVLPSHLTYRAFICSTVGTGTKTYELQREVISLRKLRVIEVRIPEVSNSDLGLQIGYLDSGF